MVLVAVLATAAAMAATAIAADAPTPTVIPLKPFPPALSAFARPEPALLGVVSDVGHAIGTGTIGVPEVGAWVPRTVGSDGDLRRIIPQGRLAFALYGGSFSAERWLLGLDLQRKTVRYALDLGWLTQVPAASEEERAYTYAGIVWAREADGVLYVSNSHSTYARSSRGRNAAITAIDLGSRTILWRSPSLVANAGTFVLAPGNRIVSGYGFTAEADYVFVIDRGTGKVLDRLPVRDGPESITRRGTEIRVETYSRSLVLRLRG